MKPSPALSTWDRVRKLTLRVESYELSGLELRTNSGFVRATSVVHLRGGEQAGLGEEVNWDAKCQHRFRKRGGYLALVGEFTLESFSDRLQELELSPDPPPIHEWLDYRRWAFESAALDLALRQNELSAEAAFGRPSEPLHFGVSLGLHNFEEIEARLAIHADMRFKLDATPDWDEPLCARLAATGAVDVVDFKGAYVGTSVDVAADIALYERVLDAMPRVIVEDPHADADILQLLRDRDAIISWDAPIHCMADLEKMPLPVQVLNLKPSRFGTLKRLLDAYDACAQQELPTYGGGQFELGVGRHHIQVLASLFHAKAPNDVAPRGYHQIGSQEERPASPLSLELAQTGLGLV